MTDITPLLPQNICHCEEVRRSNLKHQGDCRVGLLVYALLAMTGTKWGNVSQNES